MERSYQCKFEPEPNLHKQSEVDLSRTGWEPQSSKSTIQAIAINKVKRLDYAGHKEKEISLTSVAENIFNVSGCGVPSISGRHAFTS